MQTHKHHRRETKGRKGEGRRRRQTHHAGGPRQPNPKQPTRSPRTRRSSGAGTAATTDALCAGTACGQSHKIGKVNGQRAESRGVRRSHRYNTSRCYCAEAVKISTMDDERAAPPAQDAAEGVNNEGEAAATTGADATSLS